MKHDELVKVTTEFGLVVRRNALADRGVTLAALLTALEVEEPLDSNGDLISFGPSFGQEALDVMTSRLVDLGLTYFDDFFELSFACPVWCELSAKISTVKI